MYTFISDICTYVYVSLYINCATHTHTHTHIRVYLTQLFSPLSNALSLSEADRGWALAFGMRERGLNFELTESCLLDAREKREVTRSLRDAFQSNNKKNNNNGNSNKQHKLQVRLNVRAFWPRLILPICQMHFKCVPQNVREQDTHTHTHTHIYVRESKQSLRTTKDLLHTFVRCMQHSSCKLFH